MKKTLLHDHHNRQDKAKRGDYRDEMPPRRTGTWSGKSGPSTPSSCTTFTFTLPFTQLKPPVVEALRALLPNIELANLVCAIASELGRHKVQRQTRSLSRKPSVKETQNLLELVRRSGTVPARFYKWHRDIPYDLTEPPVIPEQFHMWLAKMVPQ
jgi:hypothetical protein